MKLTQSQQDWAKIYMPTIINLTAGTGIFPEVVLAQAILESSRNGVMPGSLLAKQYFNLFGIKAATGTPAEAIVRLQTREVVNGKTIVRQEPFRRYSSPIDSIAGYIKLITGSARYADALKAGSATDQIKAIAAAGYATDPNYSAAVSKIIKAYTDSLPDLNKQPELAIVNRLLAMLTISIGFFF